MQQPAHTGEMVMYGNPKATPKRMGYNQVTSIIGNLHIGYAHYMFHCSPLNQIN